MIFITRHGKTDWNVEGLYAGRSNSAKLIPESIVEIKQKAEEISKLTQLYEIKNLQIITSDIYRCKQTSLYLKKYLNIDKVIKDKRLQEIDFGSFTGQKRAFLREKYSQFFEERSNDKYHVKFPNGESYYDGEKRVVSLADELRQKNEDTLIVLHSMIFRPLIKSLLHLSIEEVLTTEFPFELTYIIDIGKLEIFYYKNGEIINGLYQET
ncbi:MAG TPA: histidine phosphatase family protein [Candidatus Dojkabacteria bacterium]|nr:histidine phosphatase family protein [Candidatus Dojkabacteria bacterium]